MSLLSRVFEVSGTMPLSFGRFRKPQRRSGLNGNMMLHFCSDWGICQSMNMYLDFCCCWKFTWTKLRRARVCNTYACHCYGSGTLHTQLCPLLLVCSKSYGTMLLRSCSCYIPKRGLVLEQGWTGLNWLYYDSGLFGVAAGINPSMKNMILIFLPKWRHFFRRLGISFALDVLLYDDVKRHIYLDVMFKGDINQITVVLDP